MLQEIPLNEVSVHENVQDKNCTISCPTQGKDVKVSIAVGSSNDSENAKSGLLIASVIVFVSKVGFYASVRFPYIYYVYLSNEWYLSNVQFSTLLGVGEVAVIIATLFSPIADLCPCKYVVTSSTLIGGLCIVIHGLSHEIVFLYVFRFLSMVMILVQSFAFQKFITNIYEASSSKVASVNCWVNIENSISISTLTSVIESSWSISILLIVPLIGFAYTFFEWKIPYFVIGSIIFLCGLLFQLLAPKNHEKDEPVESENNSNSSSYYSVFRQDIISKPALFFLLSSLLGGLAQNLVLTYFGYWLSTVHSLSVDKVGVFTIFIGLGEFVGVVFLVLVSSVIHLDTFHGLYITNVLAFIGVFVFSFVSKLSLIASIVFLLIAMAGIEWQYIATIAQSGFMVNNRVRSLYIALILLSYFTGRTIAALVCIPMVQSIGALPMFLITAFIFPLVLLSHWCGSFTELHASSILSNATSEISTSTLQQEEDDKNEAVSDSACNTASENPEAQKKRTYALTL